MVRVLRAMFFQLPLTSLSRFFSFPCSCLFSHRLFFSTDLDEVWSTLASSVVHGRLSQCAKAKCLFIKAATADNDRNKYFQTTVVSLAFDDCSNRDHAMEVSLLGVATLHSALSIAERRRFMCAPTLQILTCCVEAHGKCGINGRLSSEA